MAVTVKCPGCQTAYGVTPENLGGRAKCSQCGLTFTISSSGRETVNVKPVLAEPPMGPSRVSSQGPPIASPPPAGGLSVQATPQIAHYVLRRKIGEGAMGEVFLAHDPTLDREVAVKVLPPEFAKDPERLERFLREARAAAKLDHPNTVTVYQAGVDAGRAFIVMQFVDGGSLDEAIESRGAMPWREATEVIRDATAGLAAAHEMGLVHRDVKPANLMRTSKGQTKVADFGLARAMTSDVRMTQAGSIMGTPAYMSPEQWKGQEADARSDLYGLICSYYHLLTGHLPFEAPQSASLGYQHRYEPFPDAREHVPDLPDQIAQILAKGSEKEPENRYQSALELLTDLNAILETPDDLLMLQSLQVAAVGTPSRGRSASPRTKGPGDPASVLMTGLKSLVRGSRAIPLPKGKGIGPARFLWIALGAAALAMLAGVILYVATNHGTVKIELSPPDAKVVVKVDGNRIEVSGLDKPLQFSVGDHGLEVASDGFQTVTRSFTIRRGSQEVVRVRLEPNAERGSGGAETSVATGGATAKRVPATTLPAPDGWVDVLSTIDISRDRLFGEWKRENASLVCEPRDFCRTATPLRPDGSYEADVRLRYIGEVSEGNLILPVGRKAIIVVLANTDHRLNGVSDYEKPPCPDFTRGTVYRIHVKVTIDQDRAGIDAQVDDKPFVKWSGTLDDIRPIRADWEVPGNTVGFGAHVTTAAFDSFRLRILSGTLWHEITQAEGGIAADKWIDVLGMVNLDRHSVRGSWKREGQSLRVLGESFARVVIPVRPRGSYEVKAKLTRVNNTPEVNLFLPVGDGIAMFAIGRDKQYLQCLPSSGAEALARSDEQISIYAKVLVKGTEGELLVDVDDKPVIHWSGVAAAIPRRFDWLLLPPSLGIGAHDGEAVFHEVQLRVISGESPILVKRSKRLQTVPAKTLDSKDAPGPAIAPFGAPEACQHQAAWAKHLGVPVEITNSIGMKLLTIPPGEYLMGNPQPEDAMLSTKPQHRVRITRAFALSKFEVTQADYEKVVGTNPSAFSAKGAAKDTVAGQRTSEFPVDSVTWDDALAFCKSLSNMPQEKAAHRAYRLPTEAEWEYATRAGTATRFTFGDDWASLAAHAWFEDCAGGRTHPVGQKKPNAWGLYDMHGNLWEWCADWHSENYYRESSEDDPKGPASGAARVLRGGAWNNFAPSCRAADRIPADPSQKERTRGFRVVCDIATDTSRTLSTSGDMAGKLSQLLGKPAVPEAESYGLIAELFEGDNFHRKIKQRADRQVDWLWGFGSPDPEIPAEGFSIRWSGWIKAPEAGQYKLVTINDDGVRIVLDDCVVIDDWHGHYATRNSADVELATRPQAIRIEYQEREGSAIMSLRWVRPGSQVEETVAGECLFTTKSAAECTTIRLPPPEPLATAARDAASRGLLAELFDDRELSHKVKTRVDYRVDWLWAWEAPDSDLPADGFSIRWSGYLRAPRPGKYTLVAIHDDGARVWLDGQLVIDEWHDTLAMRDVAEVELTTKPQPIRIEYFSQDASDLMSLRWIMPGEAKERVIGVQFLSHSPDERSGQRGTMTRLAWR